MTELSPHAVQTLLDARASHWRRTRALTTALLLCWLATGFGTAFYARELASLSLFGWPLSFYLAAQGASLIYLGILGSYALWMRRLDQRFARRIAAAAEAQHAGQQGPVGQPQPPGAAHSGIPGIAGNANIADTSGSPA